MNRNKIIIVNMVSAVLLAILWSAYLTRSGISLKNVYSSLALISLIAAPVDLVAGLVCLALSKKVWASALLWSGAIFAFILVIGFAAAKM
jgi:hypothetical protein